MADTSDITESEQPLPRKDPGATRLGNFANYYHFHPPEERVKYLPANVLQENPSGRIVCLDVGCNSGDLTQEVFDYLRRNVGDTTDKKTDNNCCILGIDIDPTLIHRAEVSNRYKNCVKYETLDIMGDGANTMFDEYLRTHKVDHFSAIFCFSVTMWIHLNHGDEGLKKFLSRLCKMADVLVIEPQPWKCYLSAVRRLKKNNESFPKLNELRMNKRVTSNIDDIIQKQNKMHKIYESSPNSWGRKILVFRKSGI